MKLGLQCKKKPSRICPACVEYFNRDGMRIKLDACDGLVYYYHPKTGAILSEAQWAKLAKS
jgi:hypothetical protein